eukprot:TRINITY_DN10229_c0_g1_i1.p1 TRINITY_DN10229_c0_g1~~TRINITY_DN10229_c0_g1_i1.p1  ORF type:complete len:547 (+),score=114.06 TRINITY_DN10229_c0_g1_i1:48-1643(+)
MSEPGSSKSPSKPPSRGSVTGSSAGRPASDARPSTKTVTTEGESSDARSSGEGRAPIPSPVPPWLTPGGLHSPTSFRSPLRQQQARLRASGAVAHCVTLLRTDEAFGAHVQKGPDLKMRIMALEPGGAAQRAGMLLGACILSVAGVRCTSAADLARAMDQVHQQRQLSFAVDAVPPGEPTTAAAAKARERLKTSVEASERSARGPSERRIDRCNGFAYTRSEFVAHYGAAEGTARWAGADGDTTELTASSQLPPAEQLGIASVARRIQCTETGEVKVLTVAPGGVQWTQVPLGEMTPGESAYRGLVSRQCDSVEQLGKSGPSQVVPRSDLPAPGSLTTADAWRRFQIAETGEVVVAAALPSGERQWTKLKRDAWTADERAYAARAGEADGQLWDAVVWGAGASPNKPRETAGTAPAVGEAYQRCVEARSAKAERLRSKLRAQFEDTAPSPPRRPVRVEQVLHRRPGEPLGLTLVDMRVEAVVPGGAAARAGVLRYLGATLRRVNGLDVSTVEAVGAAAATSADTVALTLDV